MTLCVPISAASALHGGKAAGLRRLLEMGLEVPDCIAISSEGVIRLISGDPSLISKVEIWLAAKEGRIAVRSSAANEDGYVQSFAGLYETRLEVPRSLDAVLDAVRFVSRSGRTDRVREYSGGQEATIPVLLQDLIEARISGVLFTKALDTDGGECAYIEWVEGLGDSLVSGRANPASVRLPWNKSLDSIDVSRIQVMRAFPESQSVKQWVTLAERVGHREVAHGWDVEWAEALGGVLWALQLRPATTDVLVPEPRRPNSPLPASPGMGTGRVRLVDEGTHELLVEGEILVAAITEVAYIPAMRRSAAIVTEQGGLLSHAAIVAREFGKPCVVGATGACSLLVEREYAEVNGTSGVVRQGATILGGDASPDLDWTYLYLYDRGYETLLEGVSVYIEPTLGGLLAHLDMDCTAAQQLRVEAAVRRRFHTSPILAQTDRRIWHREWRRFGQLLALNIVESLFRTAIAAWDEERLTMAIRTLKEVVLLIEGKVSRTALEQLFLRETGAALHALIWLEAEGFVVWAAYRETAMWRETCQVRFTDFILGLEPQIVGASPPEHARIRGCISLLATLRNEGFEFFSLHGAFDASYFSSREALVLNACQELNVQFDEEDEALSRLYHHPMFVALDFSFARDLIGLVGDLLQVEV